METSTQMPILARWNTRKNCPAPRKGHSTSFDVWGLFRCRDVSRMTTFAHIFLTKSLPAALPKNKNPRNNHHWPWQPGKRHWQDPENYSCEIKAAVAQARTSKILTVEADWDAYKTFSRDVQTEKQRLWYLEVSIDFSKLLLWREKKSIWGILGLLKKSYEVVVSVRVSPRSR